MIFLKHLARSNFTFRCAIPICLNPAQKRTQSRKIESHNFLLQNKCFVIWFWFIIILAVYTYVWIRVYSLNLEQKRKFDTCSVLAHPVILWKFEHAICMFSNTVPYSVYHKKKFLIAGLFCQHCNNHKHSYDGLHRTARRRRWVRNVNRKQYTNTFIMLACMCDSVGIQNKLLPYRALNSSSFFLVKFF